jgi:hypothetical protein
MSAYAAVCILLAACILVGALSTVPMCLLIQARTGRAPIVVAEVSEDDYPTSPIPVVPSLPPVPAPPAPSQHFTDVAWRMPRLEQHLVDMEFDSLVAFATDSTGGWSA